MKSACFTIHPGKIPPPQNGCQLKSVYFIFKSTGFTSSTFPIQSDFSQNQPAAITLNTGYPRTLLESTPTLYTVWTISNVYPLYFFSRDSIRPPQGSLGLCELNVDDLIIQI